MPLLCQANTGIHLQQMRVKSLFLPGHCSLLSQPVVNAWTPYLRLHKSKNCLRDLKTGKEIGIWFLVQIVHSWDGIYIEWSTLSFIIRAKCHNGNVFNHKSSSRVTTVFHAKLFQILYCWCPGSLGHHNIINYDIACKRVANVLKDMGHFKQNPIQYCL